jgi:hypothetical protein
MLAGAPTINAANGIRHLETATSGNVRATLSYVKTTNVTGHYIYQGKTIPITQTTYTNLRASVFLGGRLVASQLFSNNLQLQPAWSNLGGKSVKVKEIDGASPPEVVVDLYAGGAHCCYMTMIYTLGAQGLVRRIQQSWGSAGYRLVDIDGDGTFEFQSANDGFAYAFTDYADSVDPIQIWDLQGGKLVDTTRNYPGTIAADAKALMKLYLRLTFRRSILRHSRTARLRVRP